MSNPDVYVINLASSSERLALFKDATQSLNLKIIRVEAVDGRLTDRSDWLDIDESRFEYVTGRKMMPGEYGCYRSHIIALETFVKTGEPYAVILEDDVIPDTNSIDRINAIIQAFSEADIVKLVNHRAPGFIKAKQTSFGDQIGRSLFGPQGSAAAYLVSRGGAEKILSSIRTMSLPWDVALEQYWVYSGNLLSVKDNILQFTEERLSSNIAPGGYGKKTSVFSSLIRFFPRFGNHFNHFWHAAMGPAEQRSMARLHPADLNYPFLTYLLAGLLCLVIASPVWFETDAYRFAAVALLIPAFFHYFAKDIWRYDKPLMGGTGILCSLWALYVLIRFSYDYQVNGGENSGSAEGIYIFPIFYSTMGYILWRLCRQPFWIITTFMLISTGVLAIYTDYQSIFSDLRSTYANHNNPIHASGAAGFILIISFYFAIYIVSVDKVNIVQRVCLFGIALVNLVLALINILNLHSKGVWLALAILAPIMGLLFIKNHVQENSRNGQLLVFCFISIATVGAVLLNSEELISVGAGTFATIVAFTTDITTGKGLTSSIIDMISAAQAPASQMDRLKLWADALSIWSQNPLLGVGIEWRTLWNDRDFSQDLPYNIFHNGFLEIAVRYGYLGLCFYVWLHIWTYRKVLLAARHGLIHPLVPSCFLSMLLYFFALNLSNSNIRLALGESYMLLAIALGFYCSYRLQEIAIERPKTWI